MIGELLGLIKIIELKDNSKEINVVLNKEEKNETHHRCCSFTGYSLKLDSA